MTTRRVLGRNLPVAGGGWMRLLPGAVMRRALRHENAAGVPTIVYLHPWELDPDQPRLAAAPWRARFRHTLNLDRMRDRLAALLDAMPFGTMGEVLAALDPRAAALRPVRDRRGGAILTPMARADTRPRRPPRRRAVARRHRRARGAGTLGLVACGGGGGRRRMAAEAAGRPAPPRPSSSRGLETPDLTASPGASAGSVVLRFTAPAPQATAYVVRSRDPPPRAAGRPRGGDRDPPRRDAGHARRRRDDRADGPRGGADAAVRRRGGARRVDGAVRFRRGVPRAGRGADRSGQRDRADGPRHAVAGRRDVPADAGRDHAGHGVRRRRARRRPRPRRPHRHLRHRPRARATASTASSSTTPARSRCATGGSCREAPTPRSRTACGSAAGTTSACRGST